MRKKIITRFTALALAMVLAAGLAACGSTTSNNYYAPPRQESPTVQEPAPERPAAPEPSAETQTQEPAPEPPDETQTQEPTTEPAADPGTESGTVPNSGTESRIERLLRLQAERNAGNGASQEPAKEPEPASLLDWMDRVEVVALPLHAALVNVSAILHCDESFVQESADTFDHSVLGHTCLNSNGVVAGMTGVCLAILDQQQVGVDHERRGRKVEQKDFIRQSEKIFAVFTLKFRGERIPFRDDPFVHQQRKILFHCARCHVEGLRDSFSGERFVFAVMSVAVAEV